MATGSKHVVLRFGLCTALTYDWWNMWQWDLCMMPDNAL